MACTAQFVDVVGVTVLIVALPMIQRDLDLDAGMLSWIAAVYALIFGGFLVAGGRAADLLGRRAMFVTGSALVAAGSLLSAIAADGTMLLLGRALQGLGAAISVPAALSALLAAVPPGPRRGRALGLWTMAGGAGGAFGFVLGGVVTEYLGWRWVFAAIGPVALLAACCGGVIPRSARTKGRLDLSGALLSTLAVVLLILGFNRAEVYGFGSPASWIALLLAPFAALAFVLVERRTADPLVPPRIWSVPSFRLGGGVAAVLTATTSGSAVVGTLFLQEGLGISAAAGGAGFLLLSIGVAIASTAAPVVLMRPFGPVRTMAVGLGTIAAALGAEAAAIMLRSLPLFLVGLGVSGLGLGAASVASTSYGTSDATEDSAGLIGGLLNAAAQIGTAVGIAILLVVAGAGQATAYLVAAGVALAVGVYCLVKQPSGTQPAPDGPRDATVNSPRSRTSQASG